MHRDQFLNTPDVASFIDWFAEIVAGDCPLDFTHATGNDQSLASAKLRYGWPNKQVHIPSPVGPLSLRRLATLSENEEVLNRISIGLRDCLSDTNLDPSRLFNWVSAVMIWGGVYTKRGNAGWLNEMNRDGSLVAYWRTVLSALRTIEDDDQVSRIENLRSNAGTTKVHSLALSDWVIYDSRVAAALAWLIHRWADGPPPPLLQISCMRANSQKAKQRTPDKQYFRYFAASGDARNHHEHAKWNLRTNWILGQALLQADKRSAQFQSIRDIEAALFMVGEDLGPALAHARA